MGLSRGSKGFLVVLVLIGGAGAWGYQQVRGPDPATTPPVTVEIQEGDGVRDVAAVLAEEGVIASSLGFQARARFDDRADNIRPGSYQLRPGTDVDQILATIAPPVPTEASVPAFTVTVPEGLTVQQTIERIAEAEGSPYTVDQLLTALPLVAVPDWVPVAEIPSPQPYEGLTPYEGLLFPDTYEFRSDEPPEEVLARMVERTDEVLDEVPASAALDRYQTLVVASLIEREARLAEERPVISSVIANRLTDGQALQIDATVLYATSQVGNTQVLSEDTDASSPWNTYDVPGLPPTAISGAGRSAIEAAAAPAETAFRYYVVSDPETGAHAFAESFEEHEQNVAEYRALQDEG